MMNEEMEIALEQGEMHMTAMRGKPCSYCKQPMPQDAVGNPQWPWKAQYGRSMAWMCSDNCLRWANYRRAQGKLIGVMKAKHFSEDEIADRIARLRDEWVQSKRLPVGEDPVA